MKANKDEVARRGQEKRHKDKAEEVAREERRKKVAANLLGGLTYRDMAAALNVALSTIAEDVKVIIGRWQREQIKDTGDYVELELLRLDRALNAIWPKVQAGDPINIGLMLKIQERRAKYKGLDAPTQGRVSTFEVTQEMLEKATPEQLEQLRTGTDPMIVFSGVR